jgi:hypothetical protein
MTLICETCGAMLQRTEDGRVKHWENANCPHSLKSFRVPVMELEEVGKPTEAGMT